MSTLTKEENSALDELVNLYQNSRDGQAAVEKACGTDKYKHLVNYRQCQPCESMEPHIKDICCVCSTTNRA